MYVRVFLLATLGCCLESCQESWNKYVILHCYGTTTSRVLHYKGKVSGLILEKKKKKILRGGGVIGKLIW